jgi:hypothetical protein
MTNFIPKNLQHIGFALDQRVFSRWLDPELAGGEATRQATKFSEANPQKGGWPYRRSMHKFRSLSIGLPF